jgi:hypothetical protein
MAQRRGITLSLLPVSLKVLANPSQESEGQLYLLVLLFRFLPQKVTTKMPSYRLLTPFYPDTRLKSVPYHFSYPLPKAECEIPARYFLVLTSDALYIIINSL